MTRRVYLAGVGLAVALAGCTAPRRITLGAGRPTPASISPRSATSTLPGPGPSTTAVSLTGDGPAGVAARFTVAYFSAPPGDTAAVRRQRCRPFDSDTLDQLLAVPSWNGAGNPALSDQTTTATITALNVVDTTTQGVGFELTVLLTATTGSQPVSVDQRAVQLWVTSDAAGAWRVDQVSVT
jgi:hypothetical protein